MDGVVLRPRGIGRFVSAAFLAGWLAFWAVGEAVALVMLGGAAGQAIGLGWLDRVQMPAEPFALLMALFLLGWLSLWTLGGVAAGAELLRIVAGRDTVRIGGEGFSVRRSAGPFGRGRFHPAHAIERVRLRRGDGAVVVETPERLVLVATLGTLDERRRLAERLSALRPHRAAAGPPPPPDGWSATWDGGALRLERAPRVRLGRAGCALAAAVVLAPFLAAAFTRSAGPLARTVVAALLGAPLAASLAAAAWYRYGRVAWIARRGVVERHRRFAGRERVERFEGTSLVVHGSSDGDGEDTYELRVASAGLRRVVVRTAGEDHEPVRLGRLLARASGLELRREGVTPG